MRTLDSRQRQRGAFLKSSSLDVQSGVRRCGARDGEVAEIKGVKMGRSQSGPAGSCRQTSMNELYSSLFGQKENLGPLCALASTHPRGSRRVCIPPQTRSNCTSPVSPLTICTRLFAQLLFLTGCAINYRVGIPYRCIESFSEWVLRGHLHLH